MVEVYNSYKWKNRHWQDQFIMDLGDNKIGFVFYFILKAMWLSVWSTWNINILGIKIDSNKHTNFDKHVKIIDTVKYFQKVQMWFQKVL